MITRTTQGRAPWRAVTGLAALTSPEAGEFAVRGALLAVPVGATEQHGPHLPLTTDTDLAVALCARLAGARAGVVAAPPLAYGSSGEHEDFAGPSPSGRGRSNGCWSSGPVRRPTPPRAAVVDPRG